MNTKDLISAYYRAFNEGDTARMLDFLDDEVEHYVNQGQVRRGKDLFAQFNTQMSDFYRETLTDIVVFTNESDDRAAAEFTVNGTYLETDPGMPEARGQSYCLPAGAFFTIRDGRISRVVTYYNLADWAAQVS
ncbi:MAG: ketosteroid isomerase-related protein [Paracoccus sp. (in: a-proteobacteria)]|nr:ketosteroid isomerase-related protein [Paracoccus sp. (in: a-proteobacteria)]